MMKTLTQDELFQLIVAKGEFREGRKIATEQKNHLEFCATIPAIGRDAVFAFKVTSGRVHSFATCPGLIAQFSPEILIFFCNEWNDIRTVPQTTLSRQDEVAARWSVDARYDGELDDVYNEAAGRFRIRSFEFFTKLYEFCSHADELGEEFSYAIHRKIIQDVVEGKSFATAYDAWLAGRSWLGAATERPAAKPVRKPEVSLDFDKTPVPAPFAFDPAGPSPFVSFDYSTPSAFNGFDAVLELKAEDAYPAYKTVRRQEDCLTLGVPEAGF